MKIRDLHGKATDGERSFTELFVHAFLVLIKAPEGNKASDDFHTTQHDNNEISKWIEIASGVRLDDEAEVYPVVRRGDRAKTAGMITVGRTDNCDIWLPYTGVSKFHCYFSQNALIPDQYQIVDGGSKNGTRLGDKKLKPHQPVVLQSGDTIRLGQHVDLRFFPSGDMWRMVSKNLS